MYTILLKNGKDQVFKYVDAEGNELPEHGNASSQVHQEIEVDLDLSVSTIKNFVPQIDEVRQAAKWARTQAKNSYQRKRAVEFAKIDHLRLEAQAELLFEGRSEKAEEYKRLRQEIKNRIPKP